MGKGLQATSKVQKSPQANDGAAKRYNFSNWSMQEPTHDDIKAKIDSALQSEQQKQLRYAEQKNNAYGNGKFLILDASNSVGFVIAKQLSVFGATDVEVMERGSAVFSHLRGGDVKMLLVWYTNGFEHSLQTVREVLEARDIARVPLVIITPSDDVNKQVQLIAPDLYYDCLSSLPNSRANLDRLVQQAMVSFNDQNLPRAALEKLRASWRQVVTQKYVSLSPEQFEQIYAQAKQDTGKDFWLKAEYLYFQILIRNIEGIKNMVDELVQAHSDSTLAQLLYTTVQAKLTGPKAAATGLVKRMENYDKISLEKFLQVGNLLVRWKERDVLAELLQNWFKRSDVEREQHFFFFLGQVYALQKQHEKRKVAFKNALMLQPLCFDYALSLANSYIALKDYHGAEEILAMAQKMANVQELPLRLCLIKSYYGQRKIRVADEELEKILAVDPTNKTALAIKKKYKDSRAA